MLYFQMLCNKAMDAPKSLIWTKNLQISPEKYLRFQKTAFAA
jgi:hypothetical protein